MKYILLSILFWTNLYANFNFGECQGSGTFEQQIEHYQGDYEHTVVVGSIPVGIEGLHIELVSDKDVDIRLYAANDDKIVHWPYGIHNQQDLATKVYGELNVTYSGYNGVAGKKGHEFIEIMGTTTTAMTMKAFGYRAGYATVNYSWTGKEGCESSESGQGNFTQTLEQNTTSLVGTIPPNVHNVQINLTSNKDLDIQLYGSDGTAIVSWNPTGLLFNASKQSIIYNDMNITWSGYNGTNGNLGNEYITITPKTTEVLVMKVYGYEAGEAEVTYSWGDNASTGYASLGSYTPLRYPEVGLDNKSLVYYPENGIREDMPVVLFVKGGGAITIDDYSGIMKFMASKGYYVIGVDADSYRSSYVKNYFESAIDLAKSAHGLTISKLITMGHSLGGGQAFYVMKYFRDKGYGDEANLALSIDGWFAFDMNQSDINQLDSNVSFIQMNGVQGTGTDPRIHLKIWELSTSSDQKSFYTLPADAHSYVVGDLENILQKNDLLLMIGALTDDVFNHSVEGEETIPPENKVSYDVIYDNLLDKDVYQSGDCAGIQYNAISVLQDYDIDYCLLANDLRLRSKSTYAVNESIVIDIDNQAEDNENWIGIYSLNDTHEWENVILWDWTHGLNSVTLNGLQTSGEYEARLFYNNSFSLESKVAFSVEAAKKYPVTTTLESRATDDSIVKPTVGNPSNDDVYQTRISMVNKPDFATSAYPKVQSWNTDMSLIRIGNRIYDANSLEETAITKNKTSTEGYNTLCSRASDYFRWSNKVPNTFFVMNSSYQFIQAEITGADVNCSTVLDPFSEYEVVHIGPHEGNIDYDDKYVVFVAKKPDLDTFYVILYDIQNKSRVWTKTMPSQTWEWTLNVNTGTYYWKPSTLDWLSVSPSGNYIVFNNGNGNTDGMYRYDIDFENKTKLQYRWDGNGQLYSEGGHGDLGYDTQGNEVFVQFIGGVGVYSFNLDNPNELGKELLSSPYGGGHIGCRNTQRPGWCYVTTVETNYKRVFALKLDGTGEENVQNFSQSHINDGYHDTYGGASPDGTKVIFNSHWRTDNIGTFVVEAQ
ncbi:MAG: Unknown protein [uncultured Sulfurovum sp.]|uniref:Uncharacterized protein n=1 Tax=uncultured Sulfurovum sp. TaxID=269237 RepID=A0A6S6S242_9BACT|nr:MAG: Unknown protein [uncultured Sulfurovum sp.]